MNYNTPKEVILANIKASESKAATKPMRMIVLAIFAGIFIAMGAQSSSVAAHTIADVGLARTLAGCIFPVGLMMIVFVGGELFTGDCMVSMACMNKKVSVPSFVKILCLVYIGNLLGAMATAFLISQSGQLDYTAGILGAYTIKVAVGKVNLSFGRAVVSGILCNILVCVAVLMAATAKDIAGKVLAIFFPILAFVVSGFEHCVANMYYIPAGLFASGNVAYCDKAVELYGMTPEVLQSLTWGNFFLKNLLPVTIGNIIGGGLVVGAICYYLYVERD